MCKFYLDVVKDMSAILGRAPDFLVYLEPSFLISGDNRQWLPGRAEAGT